MSTDPPDPETAAAGERQSRPPAAGRARGAYAPPHVGRLRRVRRTGVFRGQRPAYRTRRRGLEEDHLRRFPNRDALLVAVVEDIAARACTAVLDGTIPLTGEPAQALTGFGMQMARDWTSPRGVAIYRLVVGEIDRLPRLDEILTETIAVMRSTLETYLRGQVSAGKLAIPDPEAACHQFRMLTYGELRERMLLGETITEETIAATIGRAVTLFLDGYAVEKRGNSDGTS